MLLYEKLFKELSARGIEYLVAGGFAVNFHQVQRATADLDLILRLEPANIEKFIRLMGSLGYVPKLPVKPFEFADPQIRKSWIQEKGMTVFSFYNPKLKFEIIDVFVDEPKPFTELFARRLDIQAFGINIGVVGIDDLIEMKARAGRDKDLFDIAQLKKIQKLNGT